LVSAAGFGAIATLQLSDEELSHVGGGHMGPSSQSDDDVG
jgi:hypothetical protein